MSSCPLCNQPGQLWQTLRGFDLHECSSCHHRYVAQPMPSDHVASVYGDDYFDGGGAGYTDYLAQETLLSKRGRGYGALVAKHMGKPGRVLDVGAASGFLLSGWIQAGWTGVGIEPNLSMTQEAIRRGLDVRCGTLESCETLSPESFDCVAIVQVIAHFMNPNTAILQASKYLKPGGMLLIETWDRDSWIARILGTRWHEYSPPSVLHWFNRAGLDRAIERHGLKRIASRRALRLISVDHAKSLLKHSAANSRLYSLAHKLLAVIPPALQLPYPGDDLFWGLYQKAR